MSLPLFVILRCAKTMGASRVESYLRHGVMLGGWSKGDIAAAVIRRVFRDGTRMPAVEYLAFYYKVLRRYNAQERSQALNGVRAMPYAIGDVWMTESGVIDWAGRLSGEGAIDVLSEAAWYRNKHLKMKKYAGLTGEARRVVVKLLETKGIIYGKAWIRRQKSNQRSNKRSGVDGAFVAIDGCCN